MSKKYEHHLYSNRPTYGASPTFVVHPEGRLEGFCSLYTVTEDTAKAIQQAGTAKGFKGVVWSQRLWLDFDSYEAAERAERRLIEMGVSYVAYDSGGRGAHFGVRRDCAPSHLLPRLDRLWVEQNFPEADLSIYTHLHPFRLPGTVHERTGRRKELVCDRAGSSVKLPPASALEEAQVSAPGSTSGGTSIFDIFRIVALTVPLARGVERHPHLIKLIYALHNHGYSIDVCIFWVSEWNKLLEEPKNDEEMRKAIRSIYP